MRTLFIGVLAANLAGCTAHIDAMSADGAPGARPVKVASAQTHSSGSVKKTKAVAQKTAAVRKKVDPIAKAKASIAGMMENPSSAEFSRIQRSVKHALNRSDDTICGYVRGKTASGQDTGTMPFLYIVRHDDRDDEAYLVHGNSLVAETVHGALCK